MKTFEDFLGDKHAKNYTGTDDDMPDALDNWLSQLDVSEYIEFGDEYAEEMYELGKKDTANEANSLASNPN